MKATLLPGPAKGRVTAIPSKSHLHRLLIFAALSDKETLVRCEHTQAEDITATAACLSALGAIIESGEEGFTVTPLNRRRMTANAVLPCGESGSTLRFMLPVVCALGVSGEFSMSGRLPERPLAPLDEELTRHGIRLWRPDPHTLRCEGKLTAGDYTLPGNVSSQYISGLLMALPLLKGNSHLFVEGPLESADYVAMTLQTAEGFGCKTGIRDQGSGIGEGGGKSPPSLQSFGLPLPPSAGDTPATPPSFTPRSPIPIRGNAQFSSPGKIAAEGDWSNAAFWLCAGAMHGGSIEIAGLNRQSAQGDREICAILERMGARIEGGDARIKGDSHLLRVTEGERHGVEIDARAIPDLVPVLSAVAAVSAGETLIKNAGRLRLKESDRLTATAQTLNALGANVKEDTDGLRIQGVARLSGGEVDSWGDHRIAMTAAIASLACEGPVTVTGAQAVRKSYPAFWETLRALGKEVELHE